jgi:hypothetical protein
MLSYKHFQHIYLQMEKTWKPSYIIGVCSVEFLFAVYLYNCSSMLSTTATTTTTTINTTKYCSREWNIDDSITCNLEVVDLDVLPCDTCYLQKYSGNGIAWKTKVYSILFVPNQT